MSIKISDKLTLPIEMMALASAVLGVRGSGKTNTAVCAVEDLLEVRHQVIVIDPLDVWWGLKSSADGKREGYPVTVLGGIHADLPMTESDGKTIADFLTDNPVSAILSMRHLSGSAQRRFMADFAEHLFHRKGEAGRNTPVMIVVDEASQFVPQFVRSEEARMLGAIQKWVRLGRSSGIGVILIDQRAASVNKDVLSQIELLVAHRLTSPQDRKALKEWVDGHDIKDQGKTFFDTVSSLKLGEAWFWSPSFLDVFARVQVRERRTFDSSATPKLGKQVAAPAKLAKVELDKLRDKLAVSIEKARADDPKELRKKIAELEKAVKSTVGSGQSAVKVEIKTVEKPVITDAQISRLEAILARADKRIESVMPKIGELVNPISALLHDASADARQLLSAARAVRDVKLQPSTNARPAVQSATPLQRSVIKAMSSRAPHASIPVKTVLTDDNTLSGPQQRILNAIAWWQAIGVDAPSRYQVGFVAGIKPTGGHFSNNIGPLSSRGLIVARGDGVTLTESGTDLATLPPATPTLAEYHDLLRSIIKKGPSQAILNVVINADGVGVDTAHIGEQTKINPAGGHFSNSIGPLSTLGLIERRSGTVLPTKLLFPEGLA